MVDIFRCRRGAVYHNTARRTPAEIKRETGCTHIINGGFFNSTFQPVGWTVVEGKTIASDQYTDWGVSIGYDGLPIMSTDRGYSFLSGVPILKNGAKLQRDLTPDVARKAERTAVGWMKDGQVLLWCDKQALTREQLQEKLLSYGCIDGIMLDGGGSTQGVFPDGAVSSSRIVATLLLFWEEEETEMNVKTYSLCKDGATSLAEHFRVKEFRCKDGSDTILISDKLVELLENIRNRFGKPVVIHSAYRTEAYNAQVGGAAKSQHKLGKAADISIAGVTPLEIAQVAERLLPTSGGIGVYGTFTHVDVRDSRARWDSRSGKETVVSGWEAEESQAESELEAAVKWITESGIMKGNGTDLMLEKTLTREQLAVMLYRYHCQA